MSKLPKLSIAMLPPPGFPLTLPTPENPYPASNPPIFNDAMAIRTTVFIDEQHCDPLSEVDDDDSRSWHWVFYDEEGDTGSTTPSTTPTPTPTQKRKPVGVLRLVPPPHEPHDLDNARSGIFTEPTTPYIKFGRVALLKEYRGKGLGKFILGAALEWARAHPEEITEALRRSMATTTTAEQAAGQARRRTSGMGVDGEGWTGLSLVHAQKVMEPMYARCGFVRDDRMGTWIEQEMVHVGMWQTVDVKKKP